METNQQATQNEMDTWFELDVESDDGTRFIPAGDYETRKDAEAALSQFATGHKFKISRRRGLDVTAH